MRHVVVKASRSNQQNLKETYVSRLGDHVCEKLLKVDNIYAEARETDTDLIISVFSDDSANDHMFDYNLSKADIECNEEDMTDDVQYVVDDIRSMM